MQIEEFVERLRSAHGSNLVAVVLYGNALEGGSEAGASGLHTLAILDRIRPEDLRAAQPPVVDWVAEGHPPPVYFTAAEVAEASDVFPIEFLGMMENRRVLHGRDPFEGLVVSTRHLRHQVEYELRGKLIRLRELYIPQSADAARLTELLVDSLGTFARLFRYALRLVGAPATGGSRRDMVHAAIAHFELDAEPFEQILEALDRRTPMREVDAHACFGAYIEQVERVIAAVDRLPED